MGSPSLLQGIFPTQGPNPGLPLCWWILYHLSHQGSSWGPQYKPMRCYVTLGMRAWDNLMESPHFSPCLACCCCWKNLEEIRVLKGDPVFGEQICEIYGFSIFSPNLEHSHYPDMDKQVIPLGGKCFQIVSHPPHYLVSPIKMLISHPHIELTAICLLVWISWFPSLLRHASWNKDDSDKGAKARVLAIKIPAREHKVVGWMLLREPKC